MFMKKYIRVDLSERIDQKGKAKNLSTEESTDVNPPPIWSGKCNTQNQFSCTTHTSRVHFNWANVFEVGRGKSAGANTITCTFLFNSQFSIFNWNILVCVYKWMVWFLKYVMVEFWHVLNLFARKHVKTQTQYISQIEFWIRSRSTADFSSRLFILSLIVHALYIPFF